ncbi:hypothetical protein pipiens_011384 [Culex pipiens pipiens]|uniref:Uncharacterized protein n=1 Tax=Culex pipiens pipiens TaxID=38569 RepID=A0ABD1D6K9_CULPP
MYGRRTRATANREKPFQPLAPGTPHALVHIATSCTAVQKKQHETTFHRPCLSRRSEGKHHRHVIWIVWLIDHGHTIGERTRKKKKSTEKGGRKAPFFVYRWKICSKAERSVGAIKSGRVCSEPSPGRTEGALIKCGRNHLSPARRTWTGAGRSV